MAKTHLLDGRVVTVRDFPLLYQNCGECSSHGFGTRTQMKSVVWLDAVGGAGLSYTSTPDPQREKRRLAPLAGVRRCKKSTSCTHWTFFLVFLAVLKRCTQLCGNGGEGSIGVREVSDAVGRGVVSGGRYNGDESVVWCQCTVLATHSGGWRWTPGTRGGYTWYTLCTECV